MILTLLFEMIISLLELVFGWVSLPEMPELFQTSFNTLLSYMKDGMYFVFLVVNRSTIMVVLPIVIAVENFDKLYSVTMWIIKKIPFLGMK